MEFQESAISWISIDARNISFDFVDAASGDQETIKKK